MAAAVEWVAAVAHGCGMHGGKMPKKKTTKAKKAGNELMMADALRGKGRYGNSMYDYGNSTKGGIHVTHWKPRKSYGGSNAGGASVGGGT